MAERNSPLEKVASLPASLLEAQRLLRDSVADAGIQISGGLGTDDVIPLDETFVNLTLLSNDELENLFTVENSFSTEADRGRHLSKFAAAARSRLDAAPCGMKLDDLFKSSASRSKAVKNVLAFGSAGSGKTTVFLEMLVYLWCAGRLWPDIFDLVVAVELREAEVQAVSSLSELLAVKLRSLNVKKEEVLELESYFRANPSRLCLVLDGLDECSFASCNKFMRDLLLRKGNTGSRVIVTSRPCPDAYKLSQCGKYQQHIQVLGFSAENVNEYVHKVVGGERAEAMLEKLREKPDLYALMSTPMFAALACELFLSGKGVAKCSTALYESVLLRVVERAGGGACKSFEDGKPQHVQALCELGRFAFRMLAMKKLVFAESDLKSSELSEEACHLGLLLACKGSSSTDVRQYRFSHLSLQEFLAAWYMERCVVKEERHGVGLVERVGVYSGHMTMFWRFLIALLPPKVSSVVIEQLWMGMCRSESADADAATGAAIDVVLDIASNAASIANIEAVLLRLQAVFFAVPAAAEAAIALAAEDAITAADQCATFAEEMKTNSSVLCTELEMEKIRESLCSVLTIEQMKHLADILLEKTHGKGKGRQRVQNSIPNGRELTNELYLETLLSLWKSKVHIPTGTMLYAAVLKINHDAAAACEAVLHPAGMLTSRSSAEGIAMPSSPTIRKARTREEKCGLLQLLVAHHEHAEHQGVSCDGQCRLFHAFFASGFELCDPGNKALLSSSLSLCLAISFMLSHHHCVNHEKIDLSGMHMGDTGFACVSVALQQCRNVRVLNLSSVGCHNADLLVSAITALSVSLEEVDVSGNKVGVAGFVKVCRALCACRNMRVVNVTVMHPVGVCRDPVPLNTASEMLEACCKLSVLRAAWHVYECDGDSGTRFVRAVRDHAELCKLDVRCCGFSESVEFQLRLLLTDSTCKLTILF